MYAFETWCRMHRFAFSKFQLTVQLALAARTLLASSLLITLASSATAAEPIHKQRSANGTMVFSDSPLVNGRITRSSYQTDFGRPVATASCRNLNGEDLRKRQQELDGYVYAAASEHNVDPKLIKAIAQVESCFDQNAVSRVGAQGVMQLMPATAKELGVIDSFNASQNIEGGTRYIAQLLKRFNQDHQLALAAYNAGPGAVEKHNGIPPYPETRNYVKKVLGLYPDGR